MPPPERRARTAACSPWPSRARASGISITRPGEAPGGVQLLSIVAGRFSSAHSRQYHAAGSSAWPGRADRCRCRQRGELARLPGWASRWPRPSSPIGRRTGRSAPWRGSTASPGSGPVCYGASGPTCRSAARRQCRLPGAALVQVLAPRLLPCPGGNLAVPRPAVSRTLLNVNRATAVELEASARNRAGPGPAHCGGSRGAGPICDGRGARSCPGYRPGRW